MPDLHYVPNVGWVEERPPCCVNGHPFLPGRTLVGWLPCVCGGHRTWTCLVCESTSYGPARADGCKEVGGATPDGQFRPARTHRN